jgi:hypothetical protein
VLADTVIVVDTVIVDTTLPERRSRVNVPGLSKSAPR